MRTERLELDRLESFQRFEARVLHVTWLIWVLVLAGGLLGLFGGGVLSRRTRSAADGSIRVRYERYVRQHQRSVISVELRPDEGGEARLHISRPLTDAVEVHTVQPAPNTTELTAEGTTYLFATAGAGPVTVDLHVEYAVPGSISAAFSAGGKSGVTLEQFVYP